MASPHASATAVVTDWTDAQRLLVKRAHDIAVRAHEGQKDKAGHPYIGHPSRVAAYLATAHGHIPAAPPEAVAAGWLHDVIEDTPTSLEDLRRQGIPDSVIAIVDAVSLREGESPAEYAARIAANPLAVQVKRADLRDNGDKHRLAQVDTATRARLTVKYADFVALLNEAVRRQAAR
ncbi:MAG: HD domain-containing protein [Actinomycetia bacterium]|nr:HD domain-containing protein [Actinomycetes bacterium]